MFLLRKTIEKMKISKFLYRTLRHLPEFVMLWLFVGLPVAVAPYVGGVISVKGLAMGLVEAFGPMWILAGLADMGLCSGRLGLRIATRAALVALIVALGAICYAEFFVGYNVCCRLNEAVVHLVMQSDGSESGEFLHYAIGLPGSYIALAWTTLPLVLAAMIALSHKSLNSNSLHPYWFSTIWNKCVSTVVSVLVVVSIAAGVACHTRLMQPESKKLAQSFMLTAGQLAEAVRHMESTHDVVADIAQANESITIDSCTVDSALIFVVIGESANRTHSSLYGYKLPTNAFLEAVAADTCSGCLLVYADAVTGDRTTKPVMMRLLSTNAPGKEWRHSPLLPAVLRKAGYRVTYFDNQSTPSTCEAVDYGSVFFINDTLTARQSIDLRNDTRTAYDGEFVTRYLPLALEAGGGSVSFFHLMGQHLQASLRYPASQARFSLADYAEGMPEYCDEKALTDIMHFDNATAYNDSIIASMIEAIKGENAILLYFTDHGEEVHDRRPKYGRTREPVDANIAEALFHIPMAVYMTDPYRRSHPRIARELEAATGVPVHTYNFPDLLLDIAGVHTSVADTRRSIASPDYDATRKRMIEGDLDYDSIRRLNLLLPSK